MNASVEWWWWIIGVFVVLFLAYAIARFVSAAFFQSKSDFERKNHGREKQK
jgi:hypothetical protein